MQPPVGLQEWIHKFEEGEGAKYIRFVLVFLALLGLAALWHVREAKNFNTVEAMDTAQLARNIANGKGYTTQFVRPLSLALIESHRGGTRPLSRRCRWLVLRPLTSVHRGVIHLQRFSAWFRSFKPIRCWFITMPSRMLLQTIRVRPH